MDLNILKLGAEYQKIREKVDEKTGLWEDKRGRKHKTFSFLMENALHLVKANKETNLYVQKKRVLVNDNTLTSTSKLNRTKIQLYYYLLFQDRKNQNQTI